MSERGKERLLIVCADDYGMGPETSRGILELAEAGVLGAAVLLVNSPCAEDAARLWRSAAPRCDFGWHPNLTLDAPILPAAKVPSLVDAAGRFLPLGQFLVRWRLGRLRRDEIAAELAAQLDRFRDLVGAEPTVVNSHQHVAAFDPIGDALAEVLADVRPRPFVRRIRESAGTLAKIPGARLKRAFLARAARVSNRVLDAAGFPGNDILAGIANHPDLRDDGFFLRWISNVPGRIVELMVHPGYWDDSLVGRDCVVGDGCQLRRERERLLLGSPNLAIAIREAGFRTVRPSILSNFSPEEVRDAA